MKKMILILILILSQVLLLGYSQGCFLRINGDNINTQEIKEVNGNLNVFTLRNPEKSDKLNFNNTIPFTAKEDRLVLKPDIENLPTLTVISVFKPDLSEGEVELWSIQSDDISLKNSTSVTKQNRKKPGFGSKSF